METFLAFSLKPGCEQGEQGEKEKKKVSLIHSERAPKNNVETKKVDLSPPWKLLRGRLGDGAQK